MVDSLAEGPRFDGVSYRFRSSVTSSHGQATRPDSPEVFWHVASRRPRANGDRAFAAGIRGGHRDGLRARSGLPSVMGEISVVPGEEPHAIERPVREVWRRCWSA